MDNHSIRRASRGRRFALRLCVIAGCMSAGLGAGPAWAGEAITLKSAIETALKGNIDLKQVTNQFESQEIAVKRSKMDFFPDLRLSMGTSRSYSKEYSEASMSYEGTQSNRVSASASSGWTLFSGFERLATLQQSKLEREAGRKNLARSREQIIFETVQQFVLVVLDGDLIKVNDENLAAQRRQLEQIEAFTKAGRRPVVDLYQQQAAVADAESRLLLANRNYEVDKFGLLQVLAIDPEAERDIVAPDVDNVSAGVSALVRDEAVAEGLQSRADLAAQRLQVEAARKQIKAIRSGYWPLLSFSASAGTSYYDKGNGDFSGQFYDNNPSGSLSLALSLPIFDRLGTHYSVAQAEVNLRQAQLDAEKLELQVKVDIRQALEDYATTAKAVEVAESQYKYSAQALKSMEERYKVGASTLVELTQVRASNLQSSYNLINARYAHLMKGLAVLYYSGTIGNAMPLFE